MTEETSNTQEQEISAFDPKKPETLVAFLEKEPRPAGLDALAAGVNAKKKQSRALKKALGALVEEGTLVETRDGRYGIPAKMNLVVGKLTCHEKGFGFVVPRDRTVADLYIPRRKLGNALHGDTVIARPEATRGGKTEGRVIRMLRRARTQVVGKFEQGSRFGYVVPLDPRIGYQVFVSGPEADGAKPGQLVCAEITSYPEGNGRRNPEGKIIEVLGDPDDPKIDVDVIIREFNLPHAFPDKVIAEADKIATEVSEADIEGRKDFREIPVVTIDGENAKDFDDAVYVEKLPNGNFKLAIHIADVSAYVPVGSAMDIEAQRRATSVYFPDRVVPMLPESLSNEICSLKPEVDRLVQSIEIEINSEGRTVNYEFHDGVIRSAARMTYKEVAAILDGSDDKLAKKYADHVEHFKLMSALCEALQGHRGRRGSIDFDLPAPELLINMRGEVEDIFRSERNQAHRLIEEFMIRANEVVASHFAWEDVPSLYRVHEGPDAEKVEKFRDFIGGLGLRLGGGRGQPKSKDFQRLVEHLAGQPGERVIIYQMLRTMKQARYQRDNMGHFGLASERYTHFTSPIRRYPDLVVHRLLKADLESTKQEAFDVEALQSDLDGICADCSERERTAEEAERRYVDWKTVQFMADKLGESFEAFVTGVHAYGFFVELDRFFVEGLVHISSLEDDYYRFDERRHELKGENKGRTLTLGNRVKVQLAKVDKGRRRLDFALEEGPLETGIKPLEVAAEERDSAEAPASRRRRRRPRKKSTAGASAEAGGAASDAGADKSAGDEAGGSGRRRRRGSRRGRGSRGGAKAAEASTGEKAEGDAKTRRRRSASAKDGDATSRRRTSRSGDRKTSRTSSRGGAKKTTSRSADGREGGRKRSTSSRKKATSATAAGTATETTKTATKKVEAPEEGGQRPKVNPYLTDL